MDERANLLFYWFFKGRNSFKSRLPHKIPREIFGGSFCVMGTLNPCMFISRGFRECLNRNN